MADTISGVSSGSAVDYSGLTQNSRIPIKTLGQDDFLKLLVTQMTSQDPLNPQKDTEFIAQMAQFSSLEQAKTMQTDISAMRQEQNVLRANALIGQTVKVQAGDAAPFTGMVSSITIEAGTPKLIVDSKSYDLNSVSAIAPTFISSTP